MNGEPLFSLFIQKALFSTIHLKYQINEKKEYVRNFNSQQK